MAKADVVAAQLAVIQAAEVQAISDGLGACYDQGVADQVPSGGASQADIDAAVKAATDPLNEQVSALQAQVASDAQSLTDAQAKAASDLAAVQQALTDMTAKEQLEEQAVAGLQSAITQVQTSLDAIKSIVLPILNPPSA